MDIFKIFRKKEDNTEVITDLQDKVIGLEESIKKSLNNDLAGIIGSSFLTLGVDKNDYYQNNYTINKGIDMIAMNISSLPLKLFRGETELPIDHTFPNGFHMSRPHPTMSLTEWMYNCVVYYTYRGEFIAHIIIDDGIFRIQPINPKKMERNKKGSWKFDNKLVIPNEELIYIPVFNPDSDRGLSPMDVLKTELVNDAAAGNYNTKFFENFAKIGGTLVDKDGTATHDDMKKVVGQFNLAHQSSDKAYKTVGLPRGISYEESSQTMREMEFLNSRDAVRNRILAMLGIHPALFGITDQVNRSVAEEATRQFWTTTLKPKALTIQQKLNQQLFNRYYPGFHCEFDFSQIKELQENMESLLTQAKQLREIGYSTNEINTHLNLGMEDIKDPIGDMRFVPNNLISVDDMFIDDVGEEPKSFDITVDKAVSMLNTKRVSPNYINNFNRVLRSVEKEMFSKIGNYFAKQLGKVLFVVNENKMVSGTETKAIDINVILSEVMNLLNDEKQVLVTLTKPIYEKGSKKASQLALTTIKSTTEPYIDDLVVNSMVNRIANINNYTYRLIRNEVKAGVAAGETIPMISKRITRVYKFNSARARTIAATESANLLNRTAFSTYKKEKVEKKQWLAVMDNKTRDSHAENYYIGPVDINYIYPNSMKFPGDMAGSASEVINCRCAISPVIKE